MIVLKARHGKRYTQKVLARGPVCSISTSTTTGDIYASAAVRIEDEDSQTSQIICVQLSEAELIKMLEGIRHYKKHFNADGSVI